jgi:hypothetical protein
MLNLAFKTWSVIYKSCKVTNFKGMFITVKVCSIPEGQLRNSPIIAHYRKLFPGPNSCLSK